MAGIIDGVQEAIGDLRDFQSENQQVEKWHSDSLDAGRQVVEGLDGAEKASEGFAEKAAEVEDRTGDVISGIDELIIQAQDILGKIVLATTSVEESKVLQQEAKDGLDKATTHYEDFTDGLCRATDTAGGAQKKAESAWRRLVDVDLEYSTQEGGAGTSMLKETEVIGEQTGAYVDELMQAYGGLEGDAVFMLEGAKATLAGINLEESRHDSRTTSMDRVRGRLSSVLNTLKQSREILHVMQAKTAEDKESIFQTYADIKTIHEKTDTVVGVLGAQKDVSSTNAQLTTSAIDNGNRYLARIRKS